MLKLISLVTPCYNSTAFISRLYESILMQEGVKIEWVLVDDCSSDKTIDLIKTFKSTELINIKIYKLNTNSGGGGAIAKGVEHSTGDIIMIIDHDDELCEKALKNIYEDWHCVSDDDAGITYRRVDPIKNKIIGSELTYGMRFTSSWQKNTKPDITDMNFAIKSEVMKKYIHSESMRNITMMGVIWNRMSKSYKFMVGNQSGFIKYHRDNSDSQTLSVKISWKTVYTYAKYLDLYDKYYLFNTKYWIKHILNLISFSILVHGKPLYSFKYLESNFIKSILFFMTPLGYLKYKFVNVNNIRVYKHCENEDEVIYKTTRLK